MIGYPSRLVGRKQVAEGTMAFQFGKPRNFLFRPGQFVDLAPNGARSNGSDGLTHAFSIASSPLAEEIVVATRMRDTVFKRALSILAIGAEVRIKGPMGSFTLHKNISRPAVFLAGGIGVAPFRIMISYAAANKLHPPISLFYANRYLEGLLLWRRFGNWKGRLESSNSFQPLLERTTLIGNGGARLATSARKCFPDMYPTRKTRSATSPGHPPWPRRVAWHLMQRVSMKMISERKSLQAIKKSYMCVWS